MLGCFHCSLFSRTLSRPKCSTLWGQWQEFLYKRECSSYFRCFQSKGCLQVTFAFASTWDVMNGFHGTMWSCLHVTSVFASNAENGCGTHSLPLCFYPLNAKGDIDVDAPQLQTSCVNSALKRSQKIAWNSKEVKQISNKKVLLRERKRHTARRVASARYADLSRGGTPSHVRGGGGYPVPCLGGGTPSHAWGGTPPNI